MFRVAIKDSAVDGNPAVRAAVADHGTKRNFESRQQAESFATAMREQGSDVRLQAAAGMDPADVDAYLVKDGQRNEWVPVDDETTGVTFPVGGNVYGRIGLAIIYMGGTVSPALSHFADKLGTDSQTAHVRNVEIEPALPTDVANAVTWCPDLRIGIALDEDAAPESYYAEVKSGQASFQRNQRRDMQRLAKAYGVLRIRVELADLPERYTVRIDEVHPDEWPS